jgi:hypothetical protein
MTKLDALGADVSAEIVSDELHVMLMDLITVTKLTPEQQRHAMNVMRESKKKIDADRKRLGDDEYKKLERMVRMYTAAFCHVISYQFYTAHGPTILDEQAAEKAKG